jgi:hypothetical protein
MTLGVLAIQFSSSMLFESPVTKLNSNMLQAIFSISNDNPVGGRVLYFLVTSLILFVCTVCIAFRDNVAKLLRKRTK